MRRADRAWTPRRDSKPETSEAKRRGDGETYPWTRREIEMKEKTPTTSAEMRLHCANRTDSDAIQHHTLTREQSGVQRKKCRRATTEDGLWTDSDAPARDVISRAHTPWLRGFAAVSFT